MEETTGCTRRQVLAAMAAGTGAFGKLPIGAYNPWIRYHCTPEQAWVMGNHAGAERFIPVHHQTFQLSREPLEEPIERFQDAAGNAQDRVAVRRIGEEFRA
jgi:L-ascorbate metabolism protein UlaG (beta-lactamase superfamily)